MTGEVGVMSVNNFIKATHEYRKIILPQAVKVGLKIHLISQELRDVVIHLLEASSDLAVQPLSSDIHC